jgi:hypothetical protein
MKFENHEICQVLMISYEVVKKMENVGASFLQWWASEGSKQAVVRDDQSAQLRPTHPDGRRKDESFLHDLQVAASNTRQRLSAIKG